MSWEGSSLSTSVFYVPRQVPRSPKVQHPERSTSTDPAKAKPGPLQAFSHPAIPSFGAMPATTFSSTPLAPTGTQEQDRTRQGKARHMQKHETATNLPTFPRL